MKKMSTIKYKGILITWIISYIIIYLIMILFGYIPYLQGREIIDKELNKNNYSKLYRYGQQIDALLDSMQRISQEIMINPRVKDYIYNQSEAEDYSHYNLYELRNDLARYRKTNDFVEDIFIYFEEFDTIIGPSGKNPSTLFFNTFYAARNLSYDNWLNSINGKQDKYFVKLPSYEAKNNSYCIALVKSFPYFSDAEQCLRIIVTINFEKIFSKTISGDYDEGTNLIIFDKNGGLVSSSHNFELKDLTDVNYNQENLIAIQEGKYKDKKVSVYSLASQTSNYNYYYIVPNATFQKSLTYFNKFFFVCMVFCTLIGVGCIIFIARNHYKPIEGIVKIINDSSDKINNSSNEFNLIKEGINKIISEKERYSDAFQLQNDMLKDVFYVKLLKRQYKDKASLIESLKTYNISFEHSYFVTLIISIKEYKELFFEEGKESDENRYMLAQIIIHNIMNEMISEKYNCTVVQCDNNLVFLINTYIDTINNLKEDLYYTISKAQEVIRNNFNAAFTVAISSVHKKMIGIADCYRESLDTLEYNTVMEKDEIMFYDDLKILDRGMHFCSFKSEYRLVNCIKSGNKENALNVLELIFAENIEGEAVSAQTAKFFVLSIVSVMFKTLEEICEERQNINALKRINPADDIMKCQTISEMRAETIRILSDICEVVSEMNERKSIIEDSLFFNVNSYIMGNYNDPNLNVSKVSEVLGMNMSYISRNYKEQTGDGLLEYINRVRVEKAKEILSIDSMTVKDAAISVGFTNVKTFTRAFKKYVGITPGKYREIE